MKKQIRDETHELKQKKALLEKELLVYKRKRNMCRARQNIYKNRSLRKTNKGEDASELLSSQSQCAKDLEEIDSTLKSIRDAIGKHEKKITELSTRNLSLSGGRNYRVPRRKTRRAIMVRHK
jgi:hypothetical protein